MYKSPTSRGLHPVEPPHRSFYAVRASYASPRTEDPVCVPGDRCIYTWANICGSTRTGSYAADDVRRLKAREFRSRLCTVHSNVGYSGRREGDRRLPLTFTECASRSVVRHFYFCYKAPSDKLFYRTATLFFPRHASLPRNHIRY